MHHRQQSPFFKLAWITLIGVSAWSVIVSAVVFSACTSNPLATAKDTEQRAYALYGEFVIFEQQAATIRAQVTPRQYVPIQKADAATKPTIDALLKAVLDYDSAAHAIKIAHGDNAALVTATANLQKSVTQARHDIIALTTAVKGATP